mgnify:FL=1
MKLITLFESMTGAKVKDCISNVDMRGSRKDSLTNSLIFIMEENEMGKAIGKNGVNIKRMENALKKKIKLIEFNNDVLQFVKNMIYPIEIFDIKQEEDDIIIHGKDTSTKAMLIGRERQNINHLIGIVKRYFNVKDIKVI